MVQGVHERGDLLEEGRARQLVQPIHVRGLVVQVLVVAPLQAPDIGPVGGAGLVLTEQVVRAVEIHLLKYFCIMVMGDLAGLDDTHQADVSLGQVVRLFLQHGQGAAGPVGRRRSGLSMFNWYLPSRSMKLV